MVALTTLTVTHTGHFPETLGYLRQACEQCRFQFSSPEMSAKSLNAHKKCHVLINYEFICKQRAMLPDGEHQCNQILGCFPILAKGLCV